MFVSLTYSSQQLKSTKSKLFNVKNFTFIFFSSYASIAYKKFIIFLSYN